MTTSEERMRILQMIAEGRISVEEGEQLLRALQSRPGGEGKLGAEKRWFRLRVTHLDTGDAKFSVNIPLSLVQVGLKMGARFVPDIKDVNVQEVMARIREGEAGKILDATDEEGRERVEIFVE